MTMYFPQVEQRDIAELIPYANNARTHSDEQVAKIAASIKEFGFTNPILVDGANGIIAGHGRLLAARKLGLTAVPVIELAHLTDAQRKAYILADNRIALDSGWDTELLKIELAGLDEEGFDIGLTGFSDQELGTLLSDPDEEEEEDLNGDGDGDSSGTKVAKLVFGERKVPITLLELAALERLYQTHVDEKGSHFGFVTTLLGTPLDFEEREFAPSGGSAVAEDDHLV